MATCQNVETIEMHLMTDEPRPGPSGHGRHERRVSPSRSFLSTQSVPPTSPVQASTMTAPGRQTRSVIAAHNPLEQCLMLFAILLGILFFIFVFFVSFYLLVKLKLND